MGNTPDCTKQCDGNEQLFQKCINLSKVKNNNIN